MRYFFDGKIEKLDDIYSIHIPFNVWEVCKQRDVIQAEIILDNKIIECELLPEDKGAGLMCLAGGCTCNTRMICRAKGRNLKIAMAI